MLTKNSSTKSPGLTGTTIWSAVYYSERYIRESDALVLIGDKESAEEVLKQHVLTYPHDPFGRLKLSEMYLERKKYGSAVEVNERLKKDFDLSWFSVSSELYIVNNRTYTLIKRDYDGCIGTCDHKKVQEIASNLERAASTNPYRFNDDNFYAMVADDQFNESHVIGDFADWLEHRDHDIAVKAVWLINFNVEQTDSFVSLARGWASSWFEQKMYQDASDAYKLVRATLNFMAARGLESTYLSTDYGAEIYYNIAVSESNQGNYEEAAKLLGQLQKKYPKYKQADVARKPLNKS